jgi:hypothetical protein
VSLSGSVEFDANRTFSPTEGEGGLKPKAAVGGRVATVTAFVVDAWLSSSSLVVTRTVTW